VASWRGVSLDPWQRQAVLAAAALLRERFGASSDVRAKAVHDGLLEVVEPNRRAVRLQREMSKSVDGVDTATRNGAAHERRRGADRRAEDRGAPMGIERRRRSRRTSSSRRAAS
jgi:hypothetical protein